jgi:hypothetical protein
MVKPDIHFLALVVWLPSGMSAQAAAHRAAAYGLHILPISQFSLRSLQRDGLAIRFRECLLARATGGCTKAGTRALVSSGIVRYHHKWHGKFTRNWLFARVHAHGMLPYSGVSGKLGEK